MRASSSLSKSYDGVRRDSGRSKAVLELTDQERDQLQRRTRRRKSAQELRAWIVLSCAAGLSNKEVPARLDISQPMVGKWRSRFVELRLDGLSGDPRPRVARRRSPPSRSRTSWSPRWADTGRHLLGQFARTLRTWPLRHKTSDTVGGDRLPPPQRRPRRHRERRGHLRRRGYTGLDQLHPGQATTNQVVRVGGEHGKPVTNTTPPSSVSTSLATGPTGADPAGRSGSTCWLTDQP